MIGHNGGEIAVAERRYYQQTGRFTRDAAALALAGDADLFAVQGMSFTFESVDDETLRVIGRLPSGAGCIADATLRAPVVVECD